MRELMSYLPENYPDSKETVTFQGAVQPEVNLMWRARDGLLAQLNPYTADWGLDYWEDALGLPVYGHLDLDYRRRQVVAKLQGRGTTTPAVVKAVAETMLGMPVKVVEVFGEYRVELELDGWLLPAKDGVAQLKERLREIMPAHLDWGLVIPLLSRFTITPIPGPRMGRTKLPMARYALPPGRASAVPVLGIISSTTTLPMAAGRPQGRSFARRANDGPMAAQKGG